MKEIVAPGNKVTAFAHDDVGHIITVTGPSPEVANLLPQQLRDSTTTPITS
ncbi:MAG: hypothetical protein LBC74_09830 [Planctomycetaceae bacterium]|nr:hypothetical protein [Planctomycetaceae bacterium]